MDQHFVTFQREQRGGIALGDESHTNIIANPLMSRPRFATRLCRERVARCVGSHAADVSPEDLPRDEHGMQRMAPTCLELEGIVATGSRGRQSCVFQSQPVGSTFRFNMSCVRHWNSSVRDTHTMSSLVGFSCVASRSCSYAATLAVQSLEGRSTTANHRGLTPTARSEQQRCKNREAPRCASRMVTL
jgi:hypothetical protein